MPLICQRTTCAAQCTFTCFHCALLLLVAYAAAQPTVDKKFVPSATGINLKTNTVTLPLHRATLPNGTIAWYVVTEASDAAAAKAWGVSHSAALAAVKDSRVVMHVNGANGVAAKPGAVLQPSQVLQLPSGVDFMHGERSVVPNPQTGFPPLKFSYSAQGNTGYSPLLQLPDGTILNAPQVAVLAAGRLEKHPQVVSIAPDNSSVVFALKQGFSGGSPIVYISTEASDPLAATLENVPYVPLLNATPAAALIDIVAFTNGQTGVNNPQRQGLNSALKDGLAPLNIAANTPASPAYSPLWALVLTKWLGMPGDHQTSEAAVQALATQSRVSGFNPGAPESKPPLSRSGIVVNCPIIATVVQPDVNVSKQFLASAQDINLINNTVKLPLHRAVVGNGTEAFYIVTDASTAAAAMAYGANHAAALAAVRGSSVVQKAGVLDGSASVMMLMSGGSSGRRRTLLADPVALNNQGAVGSMPYQLIEVPATVDFTYGMRSVVPDPQTAFPPSNFSYSAQGNSGYSPLLELPDGTILNAPQVAVQGPGGRLTTHPKVVSIAPDNTSVVFQLTPGFSEGTPIVYISTDASDPLAATLENVPYVPLLNATPAAALIDIVAFTNGQTGINNPQRQGLKSAIKDGMSPLNIAANTPASPAYSPMWALVLAKWVGAPGDRQTSEGQVNRLGAEGKVASFDPKDASANPPLARSGIVVNCPIVASVAQPSDAAIMMKRSAGNCPPSNLGYSCVTEPQPGVRIHYSLGGSPPSNPCTSKTSGSPAASGNQDMVHALLEASTPGWLGLSFAQNLGSMWPADAVIGFDGPNGNPDLHSYHVHQYSVASSDETNGWLNNAGYVTQGGSSKLLCFSRALDSPSAAVVKSINPTAVPMNWALGPQNALVQHSIMGSVEINLAGGSARSLTDDSATNNAYRAAHGALMLAAFVLLMPSAVLMARHKWLFGDRKTGTIKGTWFRIHQIINVTAVVCALVAIGLIFGRFRWIGRAETVSFYTGHRAVGMTAVAMMIVQALIGMFRPHLGTKNRRSWRLVHQIWGWLTLALGTAAAYLGIALFSALTEIPMAYFLGPALAVSALLLLLGLGLEARKWKLQKNGQYNKHTHEFAPSLPSSKGMDATAGTAESAGTSDVARGTTAVAP